MILPARSNQEGMKLYYENHKEELKEKKKRSIIKITMTK